MRSILLLAAVGCSGALTSAHAQELRSSAPAAAPVAAFHEPVLADPAASVSAVDGCVTVHDVWKPQLSVLQRTAAHSAERLAAFDADVRQPYAELWQSYVGTSAAFSRWVRDQLEMEHDARSTLPVELAIARLVAETTSGMMAYTGRGGCGEWYALFGPGRTDMGSFGNRRIVIDFLGMPSDTDADDIRVILAHEVNHLMFGERRELDPDAATVLYRMIDEGFAAYIAHHYSGATGSPAHALSWSEEELAWALRHERELWTMLQRYFDSTHPDVFDAFFMYDQHVLPDAPGKIGYFLGYRVVEAYVKRNGADSWRALYDMDVAEIFDASRVTGRWWARLSP
jgi:hypothetical protein